MRDFSLLSSSSQFSLSVCHILAWTSMFDFSSYSLYLFSSICWARNVLIFSYSYLYLSALFSSSCLCLISFSLSYLASMSSSNLYLSAIFCNTLSAILFMKSWALFSLLFISLLLSASCLSSILLYSCWARRSSFLSNSYWAFILCLFLSFSSSIFWRYSRSCYLFSAWSARS